VTQTVRTRPFASIHVFTRTPRLLPLHRIDSRRKLSVSTRRFAANVAGGGLRRGHWTTRPTRQTISGPWDIRIVFSPTFFSETILSQQMAEVLCSGKHPLHSPIMKRSGVPNDFARPAFQPGSNCSCPMAAPSGIRHEPDPFDCRREHEQLWGKLSWRLAPLPARNDSAICRDRLPTRSRSPTWPPPTTTDNRGQLRRQTNTGLRRCGFLPWKRRDIARIRTLLSTTDRVPGVRLLRPG